MWDEFYSLPTVWQRSQCVKSLKARLAFVLISKLYRQMYANTGIATDSARVSRAETVGPHAGRAAAAAVLGAADAGPAGAGVAPGRRVGASRSAFAKRFTAKVGQCPARRVPHEEAR